MFPNGVEEPPQIDHSVPVKEKGRYGRASVWREPDDQREVIAPGEVGVPAIVAWMVQGHDLTAHRIGRLNLVILVVIAALARKREVLQSRRAALGARNDVLYRER